MSAHAVPRSTKATPRSTVTFVRLIDSEARRTVSTRTGAWLLTGALAVVVLGSVAVVTLGTPGNTSAARFLLTMAYPLAMVLPLVTIAVVAGPRTGPHGSDPAQAGRNAAPVRVLGAKALVAASIALAVPVLVVAFTALGVLASAATQGVDAVWDLPAGAHLRLALFAVVTMAAGFVAALSARRVPAAVVAYLVLFAGLPALAAAVEGTRAGLASLVSWVDLGSAAYALTGAAVSGRQWLHLATACALWLVVPGVLAVLHRVRALAD